MPTSRIRTGTSFTFLMTMSADFLGILDLGREESQEELVIAAQQAGRIDQVGVIDGVQNVLQRDLGAKHLGEGSGVTWNSGSCPP